ncbi:MAG: response regulator [Lachnospiraceae bacterium]|nr:response regulator [Lachnospiraceae bacterium]
MAGDKNKIVIVLFQYSVVVKGIERKLRDLGYQVDVVTGDIKLLSNYYSQADLFFLYLPGDVTDDESKEKIVDEICNEVGFNKKKMILVGEEKSHDELSLNVPSIDRFMWLSRPLDMEKLEENVEKALESEVAADVKRKILIVDDDPSYAGMVREWIKDNYQVNVVTAGMQAIAFLLKHPVDLILLDYEMPVVDGPQVLQMLRQEPETRHIPVVFLTGVGTTEEVKRVMALKPSGYILKSTTRLALKEALAQQFRKKD